MRRGYVDFLGVVTVVVGGGCGCFLLLILLLLPLLFLQFLFETKLKVFWGQASVPSCVTHPCDDSFLLGVDDLQGTEIE